MMIDDDDDVNGATDPNADSADQTDDDGADTSADDAGSTSDTGSDDPDGELQPDGSMLITLDAEDEEQDSAENEHFANLAEVLDENLLRDVGAEVLELVEADLEARKERDSQYDEGLQRTGLAGPAPGGADFEGASKVTHPVITEVAVDFAARVMKEICPPGGPVKTQVLGTTTAKKLEKAKRKAEYMNWQLTKQMPEFRSDLETMLTQVPLGGAQYLKLYPSKKLQRPVSEIVFVDDIIYPYAATSFASAERKTHRQYLTETRMQERVEVGMYRDLGGLVATQPDQSESAQTIEKIAGKTPDGLNLDGLRIVYETALMLDVEEEGKFKPYLISIDEQGDVLGLYRNWAEDDDLERELSHIVEFPLVPWRGGPVGIHHMIGGLAKAATGALRALLDSAHINNMPSGMRVKGGGKGGQTIAPQPGEIVEIEGALGGDNDIRKLVMAFPFNQPSPVLFQLLGFLVDAAKGVVRTTFEDIPDQSPNQPVGTTLALIEQGMTVFSAIHARMHAAMEQVLAILHRINGEMLDENRVAQETGGIMAMRADFEGAMDVVPVSDPNIFSESQRLAQLSVVTQRAQNNPLYDARKVEEMILERIKLPNAKDLLVPKPEPQHLNAVNETVAALMGRPIVAFPEQDHFAHIQAHCAVLQSPLFANPVVGAQLIPATVSHMREHIGFLFVTAIFDLTSNETQGLTGQSIDAFMKDALQDPQMTKSMDRLMATATSQILPALQQRLQPYMQVLMQAAQLAQSLQQPPPQDPAAVAAQDVQRKAAADQQKAQSDQQRNQIEQQQLQLDAQRAQAEAQRHEDEMAARTDDSQRRAQTDLTRTALSDASRERTNTADNQTALVIAGAEIAHGHNTNLQDGTGINPQ